MAKSKFATKSLKEALEEIKQENEEQYLIPTQIPDPPPEELKPEVHYKGRLADYRVKPLSIRNFLKKYQSHKLFSEAQLEVMEAICGTDDEEWSLDYDLILAAVGQGGGKNHIFESIINYYCWKICNIINPYLYFNNLTDKAISTDTDFEITNSSSVNSSQAQTVFFDRLKKNLMSTRAEEDDMVCWYAKYMKMDLRGRGLGDMKQNQIEFKPFFEGSGRIRIHSLDSKAESVEGKTIILGIVDEPSRAETKPAYQQVKQLLKVLRGNVGTRYPEGIGKVIVFAYYNNTDYDILFDEIRKEKEARAKGIKTRTYYCEKSTYLMNTSIKESAHEDFYRVDVNDANCRFKCIKAKSKNKFLNPYSYKMRDAMTHEIEMKVHATPSRIIRGGRSYVRLNLEEIKPDRRFRCFACDPGKSKDSFVVTGGYAEQLSPENILRTEIFMGDNVKEALAVTMERKVIQDIVLEWIPQPNAPIDYLNVEEVLKTLMLKFPNTVTFDFDHWQSEKFMQELRAMGIDARIITFSGKKQLHLYKMWRLGVFNNLWLYPKESKSGVTEKLAIEGEELLLENAKVVHPPLGSKDLLDPSVMVFNSIMSQQFAGLISSMELQNDSRLYHLVDKLIEYEFQAMGLGMQDPKEVKKYVMEKLNLTRESEYATLCELRGTLAPQS